MVSKNSWSTSSVWTESGLCVTWLVLSVGSLSSYTFAETLSPRYLRNLLVIFTSNVSRSIVDSAALQVCFARFFISKSFAWIKLWIDWIDGRKSSIIVNRSSSFASSICFNTPSNVAYVSYISLSRISYFLSSQIKLIRSRLWSILLRLLTSLLVKVSISSLNSSLILINVCLTSSFQSESIWVKAEF